MDKDINELISHKETELNKFYCEGCKSIYPCSTQNFGIKCDFEINFETEKYGEQIK